MRKTIKGGIATVAAVLLSACGGGSGAPTDSFAYTYTLPAQLDDGWPVGSLAAAGMDQTRIENMMVSIHDRALDSFLKGILVVKGDRLVFEEYFGGSHADTLSHLQSATKSVVSVIFGIAVTNGYVASTDDALFDYFPEYAHLNDSQKQGITLQHVLTMTPGFEWNENSVPTFATRNDNIAAYASNNYIEYVLQKDVVSTPGSSWNYNSGCPMILAGIVRNRTGVHLDAFGAQQLLQPLGIRSSRWEYQSDGLPLATGGLWLRARDTAKIGSLMLNDGRWNGQPVVSPAWIDASLTARVGVDNSRDYGYLWWTRSVAGRRLWYAHGYGGQLIVLVPASDALIVVNANYSQDTNEVARNDSAIWNLLSQYLLPAL